MILYLHGFNSSSASGKAQATVAAAQEAGVECVAPDLPHRPAAALRLCAEICAGKKVLAVGSSLGGYYATVLVERGLARRGVLINPAVAVAAKLRGEIGKTQRNYTNDEVYEYTAEHDRELAEVEVAAVADASRYLLLAQKGDELLDYREAAAYYAGAEQVIEEGGDHSFIGYERHLPRLLELARLVEDAAAE
ncbi:MAG: esterase [Betaproteobacteria bacterium AqS2]|uniref:Esterase n=1 Tax=Candidatus Amphirhobacter heronislandensis TaxID=1732024 RepID=A0A930UEJ6_9GAMM|nr:esterase [Betaproteobacteria bacterium AqS2]